MMFNSRRLLFTVLGCSAIWVPASGVLAQQNDPPPATNHPQAAPPPGRISQPIRSIASSPDKDRYKAQKALAAGIKGPLQNLAERGSALHHHRR